MLKFSAEEISSLPLSIETNEGFLETQRLKEKICRCLENRSPRYLTAAELDQILLWKLDTQYHRSKAQRSVNTDSVVIPITSAVFLVNSQSFQYETELKIKLLTSMRGIGTPLASAVLAITDPNNYCVIDSVLWEAIYGQEKDTFSIKDYLCFLEYINSLSKKIGLPLQEAEFALWTYAMATKA
jgi:thermostable 8-oxoguanine DNA glycosylase